MKNGATSTSGHIAEPDWPIWMWVPKPTTEQVAKADKIGDKIFNVKRGVWEWAMLFTTPMPEIQELTYPTKGGHDLSVKGRHFKETDRTERLPSHAERAAMAEQGLAALNKFLDGVTAPNSYRAEVHESLAGVRSCIVSGDLPAAIEMLLAGTGMPIGKDKDLLEILEADVMIYWPDFQREDSTSKADTIAPHVPQSSVTNSGTISGTSLTVSGGTAGG